MREIKVEDITKCVARLCVAANLSLPDDLRRRLQSGYDAEAEALPKEMLRACLDNLAAATATDTPICQDCGMAVVFAEIGMDAHITGGDFRAAVHAGVAAGYERGYLRKSIVRDPLRRENTGDNTPAVLHIDLVPGDKIRLRVCPKGFGSENKSRLHMFTPAANADDISDFVLDTVRRAGGDACPPMVVGVGLGGNFEGVALLAKTALCRPVSQKNSDSFYAALEDRLLARINALGIGPQGFGGKTTALAVAVEVAPTHIAGLPVAVNIGCHVTRHAEAVL
jgi:fumarate hydratase subunit alpha